MVEDNEETRRIQRNNKLLSEAIMAQVTTQMTKMMHDNLYAFLQEFQQLCELEQNGARERDEERRSPRRNYDPRAIKR
ncbi:unnamed protein product [Cochlearia groenlandica]